MKTCIQCHTEKPTEQFRQYFSCAGHVMHRNKCKSCVAENIAYAKKAKRNRRRTADAEPLVLRLLSAVP